MKRPLIVFSLLALVSCNPEQDTGRDYPIQPVPFTEVRFTDHFWSPRLKTNHEVTIPIAFQKAEETGRVANFKIAGGLQEGSFCSLYPFDDSDVFKNIEAASYSLQLFPDPVLESYLDTLIGFIAAAQEDDGYLYTNRTIDPGNPHEMAGKERWMNEDQHSHELYNAGHLYEAAVAHFQATGKRTLLDVALKNAALIDRVFGWGKLEKVPGHQEIELGLIKLYRITGEERYLSLAKFFLDRRGPGGDMYAQMHEKPVDQAEAVGHAVRAQYMYAAMADIAALTGDQGYLSALDRLWNDVTLCKTYLTGGIGSAGAYEGFGPACDLPNTEAYCETCAAIANALWNHRMFLLTGNSKYIDVFERVLYNGLLSGVSLKGDHFFYPNPLASQGQHQRREWFGCACCPVNITRFLPSLPGYTYALRKDSLYINLFVQSEARIRLKGQEVEISQETAYPWDGIVKFRINPASAARFSIFIRIPGWARNELFPGDLYQSVDKPSEVPEILINGEAWKSEPVMGYAVIERNWQPGDQVELRLPMPVIQVVAKPEVQADTGRIALQRGPVVYAIEGIDQPLVASDQSVLDSQVPLQPLYIDDTLGGIVALMAVNHEEENAIFAVPYYSWANRGPGYMAVWLKSRQ